MPLYTFKCKKCGYTFEVLCSSPEKTCILKCEKCGKKGLERVFGTFSVKGSSESAPGRTTCSPSSCKAPS
jgi:putative FmdB family regulatory protein